MRATTRFVAGSIRATVLLFRFVTQTLPFAEIAWNGRRPVSKRATIFPVRASIRMTRLVWSGAQTEPSAAPTSPTRVPIVTFVASAPTAASGTTRVTRQAATHGRPLIVPPKLPQPCCNYQMAGTGPETILFDVFLTNQRRKALIARALEGSGLPPEDYPLYVFVGAEGPWTPTGLAERLS